MPVCRTPAIYTSETQRLGYRIAIHPGLSLLAVVAGVEAALEDLRSAADVAPPPPDTLAAFYRKLGSDEWDAIRHAASAQGR